MDAKDDINEDAIEGAGPYEWGVALFLCGVIGTGLIFIF
jgi:hypothetical protein